MAEDKTQDSLNESEIPDSPFRRIEYVLKQAGAVVFRDEHGQTWISIEIEDSVRLMLVGSPDFETLCLTLCVDIFEFVPSATLIRNVGKYLKGQAVDKRRLYNRFCQNNDELLIDMANQQQEVIRVTPKGWEIVRLDMPLFKRYAHQMEILRPEPDGSLDELSYFFPFKDEDVQMLVTIWLCGVPLEGILRPGLLIEGPPKSAKTSTSTKLRDLFDPSATSSLSMSASREELVRLLDHQAVPVFDNLTNLPRRISDELCRAITGGGFVKRKLFSNDEDILYQFTRTFIINGINIPANFPDLLDRCLIIKLNRLSESEQAAKGGKEAFDRKFYEARPRILGAVLSVLSETMKIRPEIEADSLERMDDWVLWGSGIAEVLGYGIERFREAYRRNISYQHEAVADTDPLCQVLGRFVSANGEHWQGKPTELYSSLAAIAEDQGLNREQGWPRASNAMTRRLRELETTLRGIGISLTTHRTKSERMVTIHRQCIDE